MNTPRSHPALARADDLCASGAYRDAIDLLMGEIAACPDAELERRLVHIRHDAFYGVEHRGPREWPPTVDVCGDDRDGLPEVSGTELSVERLTSGIQLRGALLVRNLIPAEQAGELAEGIDRSFRGARGAASDSDDDPSAWYTPFEPDGVEAMEPGKSGRQFVRQGGGVWTADSPRMLFSILDVLTGVGFVDLVNDYFGEDAAISVKKSTLRIVPPDSRTNWHQDGAFLGEGIRTLNLWLALSDCGIDSPSLDVVPRRLEDLMETGSHGAAFDWSAGHDLVAEIAGPGGIVRPVFQPGDALLFDHMFMHRTGVDETMTRPRYAIESWFFASSCYPTGQVPLLI